eukprot:6018957-Pyramimonas_sp.AAC.1
MMQAGCCKVRGDRYLMQNSVGRPRGGHGRPQGGRGWPLGGHGRPRGGNGWPRGGKSIRSLTQFLSKARKDPCSNSLVRHARTPERKLLVGIRSNVT